MKFNTPTRIIELSDSEIQAMEKIYNTARYELEPDIKEGFIFDIGPTWYWMPDVFEKFFNDFGKKVSDYYQLERLNPGYEVYFDKNDSIKIADNLEEIKSTFESIAEPIS